MLVKRAHVDWKFLLNACHGVNGNCDHIWHSAVNYSATRVPLRSMDPRIVFREPRVFFEIWYITVITKLLPNKPQPKWRHKSPASRLFTQSFIQVQIKEYIKAPRHWPLYGEFWTFCFGTILLGCFPWVTVLTSLYWNSCNRALQFCATQVVGNGISA